MRTNNPNNKKSERSSDSKDSRRSSSSEKKPRTGGFKKSTDSSKRFDARSSDKPRFKSDSRKTEGADSSERSPRFGKDSERPSQSRSFTDKPRFSSKPRAGQDSDRPSQSRSFSDKPRFSQSKEGRDTDRPSQSRSFTDKPRFSSKPRAGQDSDRPSQSRSFSDKPRFSSKDSQDREKAPQSRDGYKPRFKSADATARKEEVSFPKPMKRDANYDPNAKYSLKKQIEFKKQNLMANDTIRLNRFLSNAGICSRREADEYIKAGVITVNGQIVTELGIKVSFTDKVMFHDQTVKSEKKVYILLNKPKDCVTTSDDPQERFTVMDLIKGACSERVYPVGRLDRNTTGVLLLTNDGDLAARLTHPKYNKKKIYHVFLDKPLTKADLETITNGVKLEDGEIYADQVSYVDESDKKQVGIEIHSGRNRIVRRIFEHLGYKVEKLDRVFFAGLTKKNISRGKYRFLTEKEVNMLNMGAVE